MTDGTIGFIGLVDAGSRWRRGCSHGYRVLSSVYRRREAIERLKAKGIVEKANPREVAGE